MKSKQIMSIVKERLKLKFGTSFDEVIYKKAVLKGKRWMKGAYGSVDFTNDDEDDHVSRFSYYYEETMNDKSKGTRTFNRGY